MDIFFLKKRAVFFIFSCFICLFCCSCQSEHSREQYHTADFFAMDTSITFTAYGSDAQTAISAAEEKVTQLESLFSTTKTHSDIAVLNQTKTTAVSSEVLAVLQTALQLYHDTDGAFNPALYPVLKAWGFTTEQYQIPDSNTLLQQLQHIDANTIHLDLASQTITLTDPATEIDLGGIVKGYASDQLIELFRRQGVSSAIVSLGGNIQTLGRKPDGSLWKVGIQNPFHPEACIGLVEIEEQAVITSGAYQRYFVGIDGKQYHHIIDSRTGAPAESDLASVTIVSDSGILADGLSTALFIMGKEQALEYWQQHTSEFDTVLVTKDNHIIITEGLRSHFQSDSDYYIVEQKKKGL